MLRPIITDARGRKHYQRWAFTHAALKRELSDDALRRVLSRLPADLVANIPRAMWSRGDIAVLAFSGTALATAAVTIHSGNRGGVYLVLASSGVMLANSVFRRRPARATWRHPDAPLLIRDAFLAERVCPACLYTLASDHLTERFYLVCPECGAAWFPPLPPDGPTPAQRSRAE